MATTAHAEKSVFTGARLLTAGLILIGVLFLSSLMFVINYWLGIGVLFVSLLLFIVYGFRKFEWRNLLLLLFINLFVAVVVSSAVQPVLVRNPAIRQLAGSNTLANIFLGSFEATVLTSILIGVIAALLLVTIPFLLVVAAAAVILWKWYKADGVTYFEAFKFLLRTILGIGFFTIIIEGGEKKGTEADIRQLEIFGGPGWLIVHSGHAVVLHHHGTITRAIGVGSTKLKREEKIKAILPLTPQGGVQDIKNVLTRDRISLDLVVLHAAQVEPAADTKTRLQKAVEDAQTELQTLQEIEDIDPEEIETAKQQVEKAEQKLKDLDDDRIIGDDYDQCYESIAKLVAMRAPTDVWGAVRFPIVNNVKDAFMSEYVEDLFSIDNDSDDLETRINERKIKEIEGVIFDKTLGSGLGKGVKLLVVDINEVHFPKRVEVKINDELQALITAKLNQRTAEYEARATIIQARAKAQARILQGQGEGEAQAAKFREILREMKREGLEVGDEITQALVKLITSSVSVKELQSFLKVTRKSSQRQLLPEPEYEADEFGEED